MGDSELEKKESLNRAARRGAGYTATHCYNTLQRTATHCNTLLQHIEQLAEELGRRYAAPYLHRYFTW